MGGGRQEISAIMSAVLAEELKAYLERLSVQAAPDKPSSGNSQKQGSRPVAIYRSHGT
jgi:hypothetical protein